MKSERNEESRIMMEKMRDLAINHPEKIVIVETKVEPDIQIEFFETIKKVEKKIDKSLTPEDYKKELYDTDVTNDRKKEVLSILVVMGEVESFRLIEEYLGVVEKELKNWTFLACQQAKMFLESRLLEETKIYIASGMGGKDHRLRYSFALYTKNKLFSDYQKNTIEGEIKYFFGKEDCLLEEISYHESYVIATCLVPIYLDLVELLKNVLDEINQYGDFLEPNVFITNEKRIEVSELREVL